MAVIVPNSGLAKQLVDAGIMPDNCTRLIIDVCMNDIVKIYTETYADERMLELVWGTLGAEIREVEKEKACSCGCGLVVPAEPPGRKCPKCGNESPMAISSLRECDNSLIHGCLVCEHVWCAK